MDVFGFGKIFLWMCSVLEKYFMNVFSLGEIFIIVFNCFVLFVFVCFDMFYFVLLFFCYF